MKKKLLSALLCTAMILSFLPSIVFAAGDDAPVSQDETVTAKKLDENLNYDWFSDATDGVYEIDSVNDLVGLGKLVKGAVSGVSTEANSFAGKIVKLTSDIAFGEGEYLYYDDGTVTYDYRITSKFEGTFDGNYKTIADLKFYNGVTTKNPSIYLFSEITAYGTVKNLTLDDVNANINDKDIFGFIAYKLSGTATNCHVKNVEATVNVGSDNKGYIYSTGAMFGTVDSATISGCTATTVKFTCFGTDNMDNVGALIGSSSGTAAPTVITDCSVTDITYDCTRKTKRTGGFIGYTSNTQISNCTVTDFLIEIDTYYQSIGGFVGSASTNSTFTNCNVQGFDLIGNTTDYAGDVGGFAAYAGNSVEFTNCAVTELKMDLSCDDKYSWTAGGFIGSAEGNIVVDSCNAEGEITISGESETHVAGGFIGTTDWTSDKTIVINESEAVVDVTSNGTAGGFVAVATNNSLTASECTASGNVTSTSGTAGGFVGTGSCGTFENCETSGTVSGTTAGGFLGEITPNSKNQSISVDSCQANGTVAGTEVASGFVGTITASDANNTNVTKVEISNSSSAAIDKTASEGAEIVDFAKEIVPDGSDAHYTSQGNTAHAGGFGAKIAISRWYDEEAERYKFWIFAGIDSLNYKEVGFVITTADGRTATVSVTTVYSSITDSTGTVYTANAFSSEDYTVYRIFAQGISVDLDYAQSTSITFKAFAVTLDGATMYGQEFSQETIYKAS